jgi:hypothetical protein
MSDDTVITHAEQARDAMSPDDYAALLSLARETEEAQ